MEPEREVATVHGLGRGSLLGFSLIVTDRKIVGIDTRRSSVRLWLSMMLGLGLGTILVLLVLFSGLEDRKSTRLNSSHVSISYAVFCLKKKKKKPIKLHTTTQQKQYENNTQTNTYHPR